MGLKYNGIIPAVITPFKKDETLDVEATRRILDHLLKGGVHGLFVAGSCGEFWALSREEKKKVCEITVEHVDGRVPVYGGTGAESTRETVELTKDAKDVGVDAVTIITPYYIKPNSRELIDHFGTVAEKVDIPILLYNNPDRTGGVNIAPEVLTTLIEEHSNVVGIKDSGGDMTVTSEYIRRCGKKAVVLVGRDTLIYGGLTIGAIGAVTSCGNVAPDRVVDIYTAYVKGNYSKALKTQYDLFPFRLAFSLGTFPAVLKEALNIIGFSVGNCRKPVLPLTQENKKRLAEILSGLGLTKVQ